MYNVLTTIDSHHRLLLTGTPLQNSLKELWCLLSYLKLEVDNIETWEVFEASYGTAEERAAGYSKLHSLLKPYIIRRMKKVGKFPMIFQSHTNYSNTAEFLHKYWLR